MICSRWRKAATRSAWSDRAATARRHCCVGFSRRPSRRRWRRCWSTSRTCSRSAEIVVRIERAMTASRGRSARTVESLFRSWNIGLGARGGGFTATLQRNPNVDAESVLLRLLELPAALFERDGTTSLIVFDEIQDVLAVPGRRRQDPQRHPASDGGGDLRLRRLGARAYAAAVRRSQAAAARPGGAQEPRAAAARGGR